VHSSVASGKPTTQSSLKPADKPLPPPKREAWMDTLMDLNDVPPPHSAVLLEEDPTPRNLSSVELLISQRYRPAKPVSLTLRIYVSEEGRVRRFQIVRVSDPSLTPEYFIPPLMELRFYPAVYNGRAAAAWTTLNLQINPLKN
ncbi:MAG: hypothetical protein RMJ66_02615, partial [Bacteroidia bacterium]|nr:hypothetical protein [Bacteroidia bacterium]MDW8133938.1 hypothetical protein [Bacteroidia bacterium]